MHLTMNNFRTSVVKTADRAEATFNYNLCA